MTYRVTDEGAREINGGRSIAHLTLADEYGGRFHIIVDDHCYVLLCEHDGEFTQTSHWFREALVALRQLPLDPDAAPEPSPLRLVN